MEEPRESERASAPAPRAPSWENPVTHPAWMIETRRTQDTKKCESPDNIN